MARPRSLACSPSATRNETRRPLPVCVVRVSERGNHQNPDPAGSLRDLDAVRGRRAPRPCRELLCQRRDASSGVRLEPVHLRVRPPIGQRCLTNRGPSIKQHLLRECPREQVAHTRLLVFVHHQASVLLTRALRQPISILPVGIAAYRTASRECLHLFFNWLRISTRQTSPPYYHILVFLRPPHRAPHCDALFHEPSGTFLTFLCPLHRTTHCDTRYQPFTTEPQVEEFLCPLHRATHCDPTNCRFRWQHSSDRFPCPLQSGYASRRDGLLLLAGLIPLRFHALFIGLRIATSSAGGCSRTAGKGFYALSIRAAHCDGWPITPGMTADRSFYALFIGLRIAT
jgi:hypothetical protein